MNDEEERDALTCWYSVRYLFYGNNGRSPKVSSESMI